MLEECQAFVPPHAAAARDLCELGLRLTQWAKIFPDVASDKMDAVISLSEVRAETFMKLCPLLLSC